MPEQREIKFRAWFENKMGDVFNPFDPEFLSSGGTFYKGTIFMQYTGLKDRNGKEIYEGDIISDSENVFIISWNKRYASFCINREGWLYSHWFGESLSPGKTEVIGNIYENANLLTHA